MNNEILQPMLAVEDICTIKYNMLKFVDHIIRITGVKALNQNGEEQPQEEEEIISPAQLRKNIIGMIKSIIMLVLLLTGVLFIFYGLNATRIYSEFFPYNIGRFTKLASFKLLYTSSYILIFMAILYIVLNIIDNLRISIMSIYRYAKHPEQCYKLIQMALFFCFFIICFIFSGFLEILPILSEYMGNYSKLKNIVMTLHPIPVWIYMYKIIHNTYYRNITRSFTVYDIAFITYGAFIGIIYTIGIIYAINLYFIGGISNIYGTI
ncbi:hypothetical protein NEIRO03_2176 [Nematocida sp. AWRm78]|nr:hypothetical protein NEIRO02_2131 [Nematocida sp. AWRm79]KAI5186001.1 hypothetical protein NEIRO03_2176 [Nematocida sp. AWRm78]